MAACGAASILLALMAANLLGFVLGTDDLQGDFSSFFCFTSLLLLDTVLNGGRPLSTLAGIVPLLLDWQVLLFSFLTFFSAANLIFYIRGFDQRRSNTQPLVHGIMARPIP
jgi:hypothetical protein